MKAKPSERLSSVIRQVAKDFDTFIDSIVDESNTALHTATDIDTVFRLQGRLQILKELKKNLTQ